MERLPAERVNTYHYRCPMTRGRVGGRRERRVDVVDSGDPPHICIRLQHHRIALPLAPVSRPDQVGGIETHRWAMVETLPTHRARRFQPDHLVSCIIRGGTANINFVHNNRA